MNQTIPQTLSFYISQPRPCPYIAGETEIRLLTHLPLGRGAEVYELLSQHGFRRSQGIAYRPHCPHCTACKSIRVKVQDFIWNKSFQRTLRRNGDLTRTILPPKATQEQFSLFHRYVTARHADGGMADMTALDFAAMIEETSVKSYLVEYRLDGTLVAAVLVDEMRDGRSLVYSFYDIELPTRSLGTFMVLDELRDAQAAERDYVYLGYWVKGSPVMGYKERFKPFEVIVPVEKDGRHTK